MIIAEYEKKLLQLEKLIESTPYDGERFIAKKKYAKLKEKYMSKKQKRDVWYALHLWKPDVTPEMVNTVYEKYRVEYDRLYSDLKYRIPNGYIDATMNHWDYGFKIGLSILRYKVFPVMPYTPYGWDYYLIGKAFGYRLALELRKNVACRSD